MNQVYMLKCPKCKYEKLVVLGTGARHEEIVAKTRNQVRNGDLGEDMKRFYMDHPGAEVDVRQALYRCNRCGHLEVRPGVRLLFSGITFTLRHKCEECGTRMAPVPDIHQATCQKCKTPLWVGDMTDDVGI